MRVLALDTTTRDGSVAIVFGDRTGEVLEERRGDPARSHAERLPVDVLRLLGDRNLTVAEIDLFAVASGPGLFTGMRVGIAAMQGLATVAQRPMVAVSALTAIAHLASVGLPSRSLVAAVMDAHRRDVFAALFEVAAGPEFDPERLNEVKPPMVGDMAAILAGWCANGLSPDVVAGDGGMLYREVVTRLVPDARIGPPRLLAGAIGQVAWHRGRRGEVVSPAGIQPLYIRRPDAELAREHALADRRSDVTRAD
jgi:tRNA threonylcarbamoyladenosine biosynthesis protein TsaB